MSGNGVDIAAVYQLLSQVAEAVTRLSETVGRHETMLANIEQAIAMLRAEQADLRQAVTHYHSSVMGHGILISDLEARMRRVEERLDLPPLVTG